MNAKTANRTCENCYHYDGEGGKCLNLDMDVSPVSTCTAHETPADVEAKLESARLALARIREESKAFCLVEVCKEKTQAALDVIESIMYGGDCERNRLAAAMFIIERAYGKASFNVTVN
jgi:hypothetical protein